MGPKYLEPLQRGTTGKHGGGQRCDRHQEAQESVLHRSIPDCLCVPLEALRPGLGTHGRALLWVSMPDSTETDLAGRLH
jgi:hypothetical protein